MAINYLMPLTKKIADILEPLKNENKNSLPLRVSVMAITNRKVKLMHERH